MEKRVGLGRPSAALRAPGVRRQPPWRGTGGCGTSPTGAALKVLGPAKPAWQGVQRQHEWRGRRACGAGIVDAAYASQRGSYAAPGPSRTAWQARGAVLAGAAQVAAAPRGREWQKRVSQFELLFE